MSVGTATMYPVSADLFGDWSRTVPWRAEGRHLVATYARTATDGKYQSAQVRIRKDLFQQKFAEIDIASTLRHADYVDRTARCHRASWRRRG